MTPNDEIRAFLRAICENPDDDTARLVFADWLDEHDRSARAEFIRVEVEIARTPQGDPRRGRLFERQAALSRAHSAEWFALFARKAVRCRTDRGFVTEVTARPDVFLAHADEWFATQPICRLKLEGVWVPASPSPRCVARELLTSPHLGRLTYLSLEHGGVNSAGVYWLSQHGGLSRLRELNLRYNHILDDGAKTLAEMPDLAWLESLDLTHTRITNAGARCIIDSPFLKSLRELRLAHNRISNGAWRELEYRFGSALVG